MCQISGVFRGEISANLFSSTVVILWLLADAQPVFSRPVPGTWPVPVKWPAAGTNSPAWHSIKIAPKSPLPKIHFYDKFNPVWWLENADEPVPPAWYLPGDQHRVGISSRQLGLEMSKCVAFGDSMSDYLLFKELEHTVSINGDATLRTLARYHYQGSDLHDAFVSICDALQKTAS